MHGRALTRTGRVITALVSAMFLLNAALKLAGGPQLDEGMALLRLPMSLVVPIAALEISSVVVYLVPATSVVGAILAHLRVGDAFVVQVLLGVGSWLGLYLREPRLRPLLPLRS